MHCNSLVSLFVRINDGNKESSLQCSITLEIIDGNTSAMNVNELFLNRRYIFVISENENEISGGDTSWPNCMRRAFVIQISQHCSWINTPESFARCSREA